MAYNRKNFLRRVIQIQEITMAEKQHGSTQVWIYNNLVKPQFHISQASYNNYLTIPAKRLLHKIEINEKEQSTVNN